MIKRALEDITNIKNKNIKLTIKEETPREIDETSPFLEYAGSFYAYLDKQLIENPREAKEKYSNGITLEMRRTLIEWMYDVKKDFGLNTVTYQVAVRILDKYVTKNGTEKKRFQLIGCASLFIAHKMIERKSTGIGVFVDICDNAYPREMFIEAEKEILQVLDFDLDFLLPLHVIRKSRKDLVNSLYTYWSEAALLDVSYWNMKPSSLAVVIEEGVLHMLDTQRMLSGESREDGLVMGSSTSMLDHQPKSVREFVLKHVQL